MICRHHFIPVHVSASRAADHLNHVTATVQLPNFKKDSEGTTT